MGKVRDGLWVKFRVGFSINVRVEYTLCACIGHIDPYAIFK